jgi:hypothetical protein
MNVGADLEKHRIRLAALKTKHNNGNGAGLTLGIAAQLAGWPTPNAMPPNRGGLQSDPAKALERRRQGHMLNLDDAATLAGWPTPTKQDQVMSGVAAYPKTPTHHTGTTLTDAAQLAAFGLLPSGSPASTEKRGALNPAFSRWLLGFPAEWDDCAATAMPSSRRSRQSS